MFVWGLESGQGRGWGGWGGTTEHKREASGGQNRAKRDLGDVHKGAWERRCKPPLPHHKNIFIPAKTQGKAGGGRAARLHLEWLLSMCKAPGSELRTTSGK